MHKCAPYNILFMHCFCYQRERGNSLSNRSQRKVEPFSEKKKQKGACLPPCLLISLFTADVQNLHNIAEDHYDTFPSNGANTKKRPYVVLSEFNCQVDGGQAKFGLNGGIHH